MILNEGEIVIFQSSLNTLAVEKEITDG
jgi:hypothetical protein